MTKKCKCGCGMRLSRNKTGRIFKDRKHYIKWQIGRKRGNRKIKRYLETPEEVIRTLKEGKEIFLQEGGAGKISLINGFCVKQWQDQFNINYAINLRDKPYIVEEESLEIKVGEWYETRNHKKARCYLIDSSDCFFTIDNYTSFSTNKRGYHMEEEAHDFDIIGPWRD